jgi:hypothetical protein
VFKNQIHIFFLLQKHDEINLKKQKNEIQKEKVVKVLNRINTWGRNHEAGYKKRFTHDIVVPHPIFSRHYLHLKEKYKHWRDDWKERSDPIKSVFEDIAIAAFLLALWEIERTTTNSSRYITLQSNLQKNRYSSHLNMILTYFSHFAI